MNICGNVYLISEKKSFSLKCIYCNRSVKQWQTFVKHILNTHHPKAESWIDPLVDGTKEEEYLEEEMKPISDMAKLNFLEGEIKQEVIEIDKETVAEENMARIMNPEINISITNEDVLQPDTEDEDQEDDDTDSNWSDFENSLKREKEEEEEEEEEENEDDDEDNKQIERKIKTSEKFTFTFYRRNLRTIEFIKLYKDLPCLWNPHDEHHSNFPMREEAHRKIIEAFKNKFHIVLTERALIGAIQRMRKQYAEILQQRDSPGAKLSVVVQEYIEMCSFLELFNEHPEDITKESDNTKLISFKKLNDVTLVFINAYAQCPALYDPNHSDYSTINVRKQAYQDIITELNTKCKVTCSEENIYKLIYALRQWYYKTQNRLSQGKKLKSLPEPQRIYMEKCKFLPSKLVKIKLACEMCAQVFHNDTTLQTHMYKKHQTGELPFKCPDCERSFEQKSTLVTHQQRSHIGKVHRCDYCVRSFAVLADLKRHIRTHTGERPYVCELCGKAFPTRTNLGYHVTAIHTKTRAFKCNMCPKDFLKHRDLKDHIKAHLNIRDKICDTCGKGFTNCHSLIRHRQIHSEVKKFACKLCDAKFHQFVGLNSHMKRTHNIVKNKSNN